MVSAVAVPRVIQLFIQIIAVELVCYFLFEFVAVSFLLSSNSFSQELCFFVQLFIYFHSNCLVYAVFLLLFAFVSIAFNSEPYLLKSPSLC